MGLLYLKKATEIFVSWKQSRFLGLTTETFTACIQTMGAVSELAEYLIEKHGLSYVLPGKLLSDPIEGRFGWYRQVNGGNFYMSVKQLLEAEKKIRALTLLQEQMLKSASQLSESFEISLFSNKTSSHISEVAWFSDFLSKVTLGDISETDANVIFFVSGYVGRSICRRRKCLPCKDILVKNVQAPQVVDCIPAEYKQLFEMADRGGLSEPTELSFAITVLAVQCYTAILSDNDAKQKLFCMINQRSAFIGAVSKKLEADDFGTVLQRSCDAGHQNFELILATTFNCFAKNELKRLNAPKVAPSLMSSNRKIRKLTSKDSSKM